MRAHLYLLVAAAVAAAPLEARAYVATMEDATYVANQDVTNDGHATVGDTFTITSAKFSSYTPAAGDPVIGWNGGPNDLMLYRMNINGIVQSVAPDPQWGPEVQYGGTYFLFYDQNHDETYDTGDYRISSGTISVHAAYDSAGNADLDGTLDQILGPELTPPFADLGPQVTLTGRYMAGESPRYGRLYDSVLTRSAAPVVPEPGTMGLLGAGLLPLLGLRRRRA